MTYLGALISERRNELRLSYRQLADAAGLSLATAHKIGQGKLTRMPTTKTVDGLAAALQIPAEALWAAAGADAGLAEFDIEEGERRAIYYATARLSPADQQLILRIINRLVQGP